MTKNEQISKTLTATKLHHSKMDCKIYTLKLDKSHLSKEQSAWLNMIFLETKWLYNFQLSQEDLFNVSYKIKEVEVLNKNKEKEVRKIENLSARTKADILERTIQNIQNLSKSKKKGNKVGRLQFKKEVNSIPFNQLGNAYKVINNKYIRLSGFTKNNSKDRSKKYFKISGFNQIPINAEFANSNLIKKNNDFYFQVTCFLPKQEKLKTNKSVGLDFGIKTAITDSDGNKYNWQFPETKQLKKVSRKFNKCVKGSKNKNKLRIKLSKEYESITNKKKDTTNKFIHILTTENDLVVIQDEMIHAWQSSKRKGFGRKIQHGIIGVIASGLKQHPETLIVPTSFPSTQLCPNCGALNKHDLSMRTYNCDCGYSCDRDIHSARNILNYGLQISRESRNTMLVEKQTSGSRILDLSYTSMKQEASSSYRSSSLKNL